MTRDEWESTLSIHIAAMRMSRRLPDNAMGRLEKALAESLLGTQLRRLENDPDISVTVRAQILAEYNLTPERVDYFKSRIKEG